MTFEPYPFEKLAKLLEDLKPNPNLVQIDLTIGEPKFATPDFIQEELCKNTSLLSKYPKSAGEEFLNDAMRNFVKNRFNVELKKEELIPTFGTREVLFNFPQFLLHDKNYPVMAYTNPFYQIYEGAAIASRAKVHHINLLPQNNFKPIIDENILKECNLVILNFPNNPTAATLSLEELQIWVELALKYDFILLNDECYSEIYFDKKPPSILEASIKVGNKNFKNILAINSISKRSSAPGLRSGFIAGDGQILKNYLRYRTYIGAAIPLPLQHAAAQAWSNEPHAELFRNKYKANFEAACEILDIQTPEATFYIWLEVENDQQAARKLYEKYSLKVLPGSFLGRDGMGTAFIRIALVENIEKTTEALLRIKSFIGEK